MKVPEQFRDAEALAEFANLHPTDTKAVEYFKKNYPDFAPPEWWDYQTEMFDFVPVSLEDFNNPEIKGTHIKGTNIKVSLRTDKSGALATTPIPIWVLTEERIQHAWQDRFQFETIFNFTDLLKSVFIAPLEMVRDGSYLNLSDGELWEYGLAHRCTFHKAVLYMHEEPWRAKFCKVCERYFVSNHPKRDFCQGGTSQGTCRELNDRRQKLAWYYATGKKQRQKKRKSSPRLPGSRRSQ